MAEDNESLLSILIIINLSIRAIFSKRTSEKLFLYIEIVNFAPQI